MLKTNKEQHWHEISGRVASITDALGMPVDEGIQETVIALNALGVATLASCSGHLDHGSGAPWVDIGSSEARPLAKIAHQKQMEAEQARAEERHTLLAEAAVARLEAKRLHVTERLKAIEHLDRFYTERLVPYDQRLIVNVSDWLGIGRLESQGANYQDCLDFEERIQHLVRYQEEMQAFAKFLTSWFWQQEEQE